MEILGKLELFSPTVENRFVFNLFDLLLCGVIVLVICRGWRAQQKLTSRWHQVFIFLTFFFLGASFALGAVHAGALLFVQKRLPEALFDLLTHLFQTSAWLMLAASALYRSTRGQGGPASFRSGRWSWALLLAPLELLLAGPASPLHAQATAALDWMDLILLTVILILFYRRPLGGRDLATSALAFLFVASLLHLGSSWSPKTESTVVFWNLEQFTWSLSLFVLALAIGETSQDLFDRVFVRLQITFIVLASLMILVIIQTEKTEYLGSLRARSDQLAEFVRAHVAYFQQRSELLPAILDREDFLQRLTLGFGNLPELKMVRIVSGGQVATFEIARNGAIHRDLAPRAQKASLAQPDLDAYFLIQALPLRSGEVEFYGTREFIDRHIRRRIILIFSLFTGMVALSTLMIGLVVRGASETIRQQAREIEEKQQQLVQTSKLAALGELAAGVAHEINNPATTIMSRASFLLSEEEARSPSEQEDLGAIVSQAQRIARITRSLLMFSRPQALAIAPTPVHRIIESSLQSVAESLAGRHISVEKNVQGDLPHVQADENSLTRALENLFRNAIDVMPSGGTLTVTAAREDSAGERLRMEICDTGTGIDQDHLARVFDPFFTTKEPGKGTGLGLSIVHSIIKEHHGTISVESRLGVGTKFVIVLPTEQ